MEASQGIPAAPYGVGDTGEHSTSVLGQGIKGQGHLSGGRATRVKATPKIPQLAGSIYHPPGREGHTATTSRGQKPPPGHQGAQHIPAVPLARRKTSLLHHDAEGMAGGGLPFFSPKSPPGASAALQLGAKPREVLMGLDFNGRGLAGASRERLNSPRWMRFGGS